MANNKSVKIRINTPNGRIEACVEPEMAELFKSDSKALGSFLKEHLQMTANATSSPASLSTTATRSCPSTAPRTCPSTATTSMTENEPGPSASTSLIDQEGPGAPGCGNWRRSATLLLLEDYRIKSKKVEAGQQTKKTMWNEISLNLQKKGYNFTPDQVCGRYKTLVRGYKNFKDHNHKSGNGTKVFEYSEEMEQLLGKDPAVVPVVTLSSTLDGNNTDDSHDSNSVGGDDNAIIEDAGVDNVAAVSECSKRKSSSTAGQFEASKKRRSSRSDVINSLQEFMKNQEAENAKKEARHKEKIDVLKGLISALSGHK